MNRSDIAALLEQVAQGQLSPDTALENLTTLPFEQLAHSTLDLHRELRQGTPEVIFSTNKTASQIAENLSLLHSTHGKALATRVDEEKARSVQALLPKASYHSSARCLTLGLAPQAPDPDLEQPYLVVMTAGTSDGLVGSPVIAVPTSVGYGIAREGETALHAMLTSCASGIAVVNIDNGFGAAIFAHNLMRQVQAHR